MQELLKGVYDQGIIAWLIVWYKRLKLTGKPDSQIVAEVRRKADRVFGKGTWRV